MNIKHYLLVVCTLLIFSCQKQNRIQADQDYNAVKKEFTDLVNKFNKDRYEQIVLDTEQEYTFLKLGNLMANGFHYYMDYKETELNRIEQGHGYSRFLLKDENGRYNKYRLLDQKKGRAFSDDSAASLLTSYFCEIPLENEELINMIIVRTDVDGQNIVSYKYEKREMRSPGWVLANAAVKKKLVKSKKLKEEVR